MFIRQKNNKSGTVSIQIIDKSRGKYKLVKTVGCSMDPLKLDRLISQAKSELIRLSQPLNLNFEIYKEKEFIDLSFEGIEKISLVGPELILGKLYDEIGFSSIKDELFRHLVITRLCHPVSKLKTVDYLFKFKGISIDAEQIYRYLDKLHAKQKERVQEISYHHTLQIPDNAINVLFYDIIPLYIEIEDQDDLRITGNSKEGIKQNPQFLLGLLVGIDGYPLAYEIFEGNKYEGHTMLPVIESFKAKYRLKNLVVVAGAGLLSDENMIELQGREYEYILGIRLRNEKNTLQSQILALNLQNEECGEIPIDRETRLIVSYSRTNAEKEKYNRQRGLEKLERAIKTGRISIKNINNRGYNKYLKRDGKVSIGIDYKKFSEDNKWEGIKGYLTNMKLNKDKVVEQYDNLWKIKKEFRISKTDLRIRPIVQRLRRRIEAHICIAFCAYKIYKELERQLTFANTKWSPEKAIGIANTILEMNMITPSSRNGEAHLHLQNEEQTELLKLFGN